MSLRKTLTNMELEAIEFRLSCLEDMAEGTRRYFVACAGQAIPPSASILKAHNQAMHRDISFLLRIFVNARAREMEKTGEVCIQ